MRALPCTIGAMKRAGVAVAAVLLFALTGCAAPASETPAESVAPLVAESPSASAAGVDEAAFLEDVRENLPTNTQIPDATDEQLLAAGARACEELAAGTPGDQISVVENETPGALGTFDDSGAIVTAASVNLCD